MGKSPKILAKKTEKLVEADLITDIEQIKLLKHILKKLNNMATKEEFDAAFAEINDATNNIADDITRLTASIGGGLSPADQDAALASLNAVAEKLKAIAATTPEA